MYVGVQRALDRGAGMWACIVGVLTGSRHCTVDDAHTIDVGGLRCDSEHRRSALQLAEAELLRVRSLLSIPERLRILQAKVRGVSVVVSNLALQAEPTSSVSPLTGSLILNRARARNKKGYAPDRRAFVRIALSAIPFVAGTLTRSIDLTRNHEVDFAPVFTDGGIASVAYSTRDLQTLPGKEIIVPLAACRSVGKSELIAAQVIAELPHSFSRRSV